MLLDLQAQAIVGVVIVGGRRYFFFPRTYFPGTCMCDCCKEVVEHSGDSG